MIKKILTAILLLPTLLYAQINTERVMTIARNALYFEDYVLSIQYFNQVINAKPYLYDVSGRTSLTGRLKIIKLPSNTTPRIWCFGITFPFAIFKKKIMSRLRKIWVRF